MVEISAVEATTRTKVAQVHAVRAVEVAGEEGALVDLSNE